MYFNLNVLELGHTLAEQTQGLNTSDGLYAAIA